MTDGDGAPFRSTGGDRITHRLQSDEDPAVIAKRLTMKIYRMVRGGVQSADQLSTLRRCLTVSMGTKKCFLRIRYRYYSHRIERQAHRRLRRGGAVEGDALARWIKRVAAFPFDDIGDSIALYVSVSCQTSLEDLTTIVPAKPQPPFGVFTKASHDRVFKSAGPLFNRNSHFGSR